MTNLDFQKNRLERIVNAFPANRRGEIKPQKSKICLMTKFAKTKGNYAFKISDTGLTNPHVNARHLTRDDMLFAKSVFVGIYIEPTAKPGHGVIHTFPLLHSDAIPAGYAGLANADAEAMYNGDLLLRTNSTVNYDSFPLHQFRVVPETQPVKILGDADFESCGLIPQFDFDKAAIDLPEMLQLRGDTDQYVEINFPAVDASDIKATDGFDAYLIVIFDGWKVKNGTTILRLEA